MSRYFLAAALLPCLAAAATTAIFNPATPTTGPFPSDVLTTFDPLQKTGLRLNLPVPDCGTQYNACQEGGLLDQLDGFSLRPRARIQFSGPVNGATLRDGIFFVALENLTAEESGVHRVGDRIAIDQVVIDASTNTVLAKPVLVLDQHRRYALVVTDAVKEPSGTSVAADPRFGACVTQGTDPYCTSLARALTTAGVARVVAASVFTTMSATAWLEHARLIVKYVPPLVSLAQPQSTFRISDLSAVTLHEQVGTNSFLNFSLPINSTLLDGVDRLVIGSFQSPSFLEDDQTIRGVPTIPELEVPTRVNQIGFNALLPATSQPAKGYPVVIFGHGFGDSRFGGPTAIAPTLNRAGMAVIAINAVGHGFGSQSTVTFTEKTGHSTTLLSQGRSIDLNGDGTIEANEGCALIAPIAYGTRDCFRQTAVDLMQLARLIRLGLDLDGDGKPDLDGSQIYYAGESLGAIYGTMFTAVEPTVLAAALNVGGATTLDIARWSPAYRSLTTQTLAVRSPSLLNKGTTYDEDYVLPGLAPKTVTVPGALPIQDLFETLEWLGMTGDPVAFAPHLTKSPLAGIAARPVMAQFARGDRTVPNPANSLLIRAASLEANTWMYRHDLARQQAPDLPIDPHPFLLLFVSLGGDTVQLPGLNGLAISLDAQGQIAGFLSSGGASVPDPNNLSRLLFGKSLFEIPAVLPTDLGF
jgi:hypothetical protein